MHKPDAEKLARVSLGLAACLLATTAVLVAFLIWSGQRGVRLEDLSREERLTLLRQAQDLSPPVFREYLFSGDPGFYHMRPDTAYTGVYGQSFVTNQLGFRSAPIRPKQPERRRIVVVGDSWTFGPYVPASAAFPQQLERMLNRSGARWEVVNLGMMGWNTDNALAALRVFLPVLAPDLVVICPTPNDINDSFGVFDGRLATQGFDVRDPFRRSYEIESRWIRNFKLLQHEVQHLESIGIPSLIYFIAAWGEMPAYYARASDMTATYAVVPADYVELRYRLPPEVDPSLHANVDGNRLIASYLHNVLLARGLIAGLAEVPLEHQVRFPARQVDERAVRERLDQGRDSSERSTPLIPLDAEFMTIRGMYGTRSTPDARTITVALQPIDALGLYPLMIDVEIVAPEPTTHRVVLSSHAEARRTLTFDKPVSLDGYDFVEVRLTADRAVVGEGRSLPISMRHPSIEVR